MQKIETIYRYLFDSTHGSTNRFLARWLFLRSLGLIYFSAFFALLFQIRGLITGLADAVVAMNITSRGEEPCVLFHDGAAKGEVRLFRGRSGRVAPGSVGTQYGDGRRNREG